jgi:hypothetical protein
MPEINFVFQLESSFPCWHRWRSISSFICWGWGRVENVQTFHKGVQAQVGGFPVSTFTHPCIPEFHTQAYLRGNFPVLIHQYHMGGAR